MPLNDSPATPVWQAVLCNRMRESFDAVRLQMDAAQHALDREDVLVAPIVEGEP